ncbi:MAG: hypothetical protein V4719_14660 [Planctomycetota bacterium]
MMTSGDFIRLSSRWCTLIHPNGDEAVWRTAISRAYYGAFHSAQGFLNQLQIAFPKRENEHKFVCEALYNSKDVDITAAASKLFELRKNRNCADYDLLTAMDVPPLAKECHADAVQICAFISQCPVARHPAIRSEILTWRKIQYQF